MSSLLLAEPRRAFLAHGSNESLLISHGGVLLIGVEVNTGDIMPYGPGIVPGTPALPMAEGTGLTTEITDASHTDIGDTTARGRGGEAMMSPLGALKAAESHGNVETSTSTPIAARGESGCALILEPPPGENAVTLTTGGAGGGGGGAVTFLVCS